MPITLLEYAYADIRTALSALAAVNNKEGNSKALKGIAAYHTQQAMEKMIKSQIYKADPNVSNKKMYTHKIYDLIAIAEAYNIKIPALIKKNALMYSDWEASGRYDLHFVARMDSIQNALDTLDTWYRELQKK